MSEPTVKSVHKTLVVYHQNVADEVFEEGKNGVKEVRQNVIPGIGMIVMVLMTDGVLKTFSPSTVFTISEKPSSIEIPKVKLT